MTLTTDPVIDEVPALPAADASAEVTRPDAGWLVRNASVVVLIALTIVLATVVAALCLFADLRSDQADSLQRKASSISDATTEHAAVVVDKRQEVEAINAKIKAARDAIAAKEPVR